MGESLKEKSQKSAEFYDGECDRMRNRLKNLYDKNKKYLNFELKDLKKIGEIHVKEESK